MSCCQGSLYLFQIQLSPWWLEVWSLVATRIGNHSRSQESSAYVIGSHRGFFCHWGIFFHSVIFTRSLGKEKVVVNLLLPGDWNLDFGGCDIGVCWWIVGWIGCVYDDCVPWCSFFSMPDIANLVFPFALATMISGGGMERILRGISTSSIFPMFVGIRMLKCSSRLSSWPEGRRVFQEIFHGEQERLLAGPKIGLNGCMRRSLYDIHNRIDRLIVVPRKNTYYVGLVHHIYTKKQRIWEPWRRPLWVNQIMPRFMSIPYPTVSP